MAEPCPPRQTSQPGAARTVATIAIVGLLLLGVVGAFGGGLFPDGVPRTDPGEMLPTEGIVASVSLPEVVVDGGRVLVRRHIDAIATPGNGISPQLVVSAHLVGEPSGAPLVIVEVIPKAFADHAADLDFSIQPTAVIDDDPIIMWDLGVIDAAPPGFEPQTVGVELEAASQALLAAIEEQKRAADDYQRLREEVLGRAARNGFPLIGDIVIRLADPRWREDDITLDDVNGYLSYLAMAEDAEFRRSALLTADALAARSLDAYADAAVEYQESLARAIDCNSLAGTSVYLLPSSPPQPPFATHTSVMQTLDYGDYRQSRLDLGEENVWQFIGNQNDEVSVRVADRDDPWFIPYLEIIDPRGERLATATARGSEASIATVLPGDGTYSIIIRGYGSYELWLDRHDPAVPAAEDRLLSCNDTVYGALRPGSMDEWRLPDQHAGRVLIEVSDSSFDAVLDVWRGDGRWDSGADDPERLEVDLRASETYLVTISGWSHLDGGDYTLALVCVGEAPTTTSTSETPEPTTATSEPPQSTTSTTVPATSSTTEETIPEGLGTGDVQITLLWNGGADLDLHVWDPSGEEIWYQYPVSSSGGQLDHDIQCENVDQAAENVFWPQGEAPTGYYDVLIDYFGGCGGASPTVDFTLVITLDGYEADRVSATLAPDGAFEYGFGYRE